MCSHFSSFLKAVLFKINMMHPAADVNEQKWVYLQPLLSFYTNLPSSASIWKIKG
jgi:hypothetical protein